MRKMQDLLLFFCSSIKSKPIWLALFLAAVSFSSTAQNVFINDSIAIVSNNLSAEQTLKQINLTSLHFHKAPANRINFGIFGKQNNYIILKLNAAADINGQNLSIDNTSLDIIKVYRIYNDGTNRLLYTGGDLVAFSNNTSYVWHIIPVEINKNPSYYLIDVKAPQENINLRYDIINHNDLAKKYQGEDRVIFFYTGIVCLVILIIAFAFLLFKKAVFAAYLGYVIFVSVWIISHYGYVFPYLYPHVPVINEIIKPVSTLAACYFLMIVMDKVFRQYMQSHQWLKQWVKWTIYTLPLIMGLMLLLLIPKPGNGLKAALVISWHLALIFSVCTIIFIPLRFIKFNSTAKIFSLAIMVMLVMTIIQLIGIFGNINNSFFNEHSITMGSLLENIIIAFGLFYSLLEEKKQREKQVLALEQDQTETLKKLITVQDNERKRIAVDLHDNIGPLLAALKINFRRIIHTKDSEPHDELVTKTESIIDDSIAEIRNVAHNLMPKGLSSNGLINTLKDYFESIQQLYNKTIVFHHQVQSILNPDLQINIYRIICELVLNAARHSNARVITIIINANEKCAEVSIHDDGQGFKLKADGLKKSLGLQSAESRVQYLKGKFSLKTEPGSGTVIQIEIPL